MDPEVGQRAIPLQCGHGQAGLLHIMEHLGKNAEIKGRGAEAAVAADSPDTDEQEKDSGHQRSCHQPDPMTLPGLRNRRFFALPAADGIHRQQDPHQHAGTQKAPGEADPQAGSRQQGEQAEDHPSFRRIRVPYQGRTPQQTSHRQSHHNDPERIHFRQSRQRRQVPQLDRQK